MHRACRTLQWMPVSLYTVPHFGPLFSMGFSLSIVKVLCDCMLFVSL